MVTSINNVEKALGDVVYPSDPSMIKGRQFSHSLYVTKDIKAGVVITEQKVRSVCSGNGAHSKYLNESLGKKVNRFLERGRGLLLW